VGRRPVGELLLLPPPSRAPRGRGRSRRRLLVPDLPRRRTVLPADHLVRPRLLPAVPPPPPAHHFFFFFFFFFLQ
jgi:hypothetical protein